MIYSAMFLMVKVADDLGLVGAQEKNVLENF